MSKDWNLFDLSDWGVLRFRGPDAVKFLQGDLRTSWPSCRAS
jgi:folate-binding Fe-S cluster repair protein YgfZ